MRIGSGYIRTSRGGEGPGARLDHGYGRLSLEVKATEPTRPHPGMTSIMRRFENFIEENLDLPLYLMDICKEMSSLGPDPSAPLPGSSGNGPAERYLWLRRMTLARRLLMRGEPGATTVTRVATGCGFGELGRFAVQYHTLFGEAPSETLRRPVG